MSDSVQQKLLDSEESYLNTTFCFFVLSPWYGRKITKECL